MGTMATRVSEEVIKDSEDNKVLETRLVLATREVSGSREDSASLETRAETPGCKMTDPAASGEDTRSSATHIGIQIPNSSQCAPHIFVIPKRPQLPQLLKHRRRHRAQLSPCAPRVISARE